MSYPLFHPACTRTPVQDLSAEQFAKEFPAESERIEFKEGVPLDRITKTAVAFSNTDGGVILLGVSDTGQIKGLELSGDKEIEIHNRLAPVIGLGDYQIHRLKAAGRDVAAIGVDRQRRAGHVAARRVRPAEQRPGQGTTWRIQPHPHGGSTRRLHSPPVRARPGSDGDRGEVRPDRRRPRATARGGLGVEHRRRSGPAQATAQGPRLPDRRRPRRAIERRRRPVPNQRSRHGARQGLCGGVPVPRRRPQLRPPGRVPGSTPRAGPQSRKVRPRRARLRYGDVGRRPPRTPSAASHRPSGGHRQRGRTSLLCRNWRGGTPRDSSGSSRRALPRRAAWRGHAGRYRREVRASQHPGHPHAPFLWRRRGCRARCRSHATPHGSELHVAAPLRSRRLIGDGHAAPRLRGDSRRTRAARADAGRRERRIGSAVFCRRAGIDRSGRKSQGCKAPASRCQRKNAHQRPGERVARGRRPREPRCAPPSSRSRLARTARHRLRDHL